MLPHRLSITVPSTCIMKCLVAGLSINQTRQADCRWYIAHVWSHGQSGRPHDEINLCLHKRYVQICRDLKCSEYWWDAACIPDDHELRLEVISHINSIFENSKATLVCDQDLMKIEISTISVKLSESILATASVCDWNLRAWTFLESFRGRHQIHLLCKDNRTINFRDLCIDVFNHESIDMAIFILTLGHMLPQRVPNPHKSSFAQFMMPKLDNSSKASHDWNWNYFEIENGGSHLSDRPASRKEDDVVIWSLLTGNVVFDLTEDLLLSLKVSKPYITTGFLMSSAPRSKKKGLSWLSITPYFKSSSQPSEEAHVPLRAFRCRDTMPGLFTDKGLRASWLVYEFESSNLTKLDDTAPAATAELMKIVQRYLQGARWGALLQPLMNFRDFSLNSDWFIKYKGSVEGTVMTILESCSFTRPSQIPAKDGGWTWKSIHVWSENAPLPDFQEIENFFIE